MSCLKWVQKQYMRHWQIVHVSEHAYQRTEAYSQPYKAKILLLSRYMVSTDYIKQHGNLA